MFLFVYGSLLKGLHNHHHLHTDLPFDQGGAKFVKEDSVVGRLFSNSMYPFIVLNPTLSTLPAGNNLVLGEVYEISSIINCDRLEGYVPNRDENQNLFNRRTCTTTSGIEVYVYEGGYRFLSQVSQFPEVTNNDWKTYFQKMHAHISQPQTDFLQVLNEFVDDEVRCKNIINKIFQHRADSAKSIDISFNRNVSKADLIECIKLLTTIIDENL